MGLYRGQVDHRAHHGPVVTSSLFFSMEEGINISGWWLSPTPLKNDGIRQLRT